LKSVLEAENGPFRSGIRAVFMICTEAPAAMWEIIPPWGFYPTLSSVLRSFPWVVLTA